MALGRLTIGLGSGRASERSERFFTFCSPSPWSKKGVAEIAHFRVKEPRAFCTSHSRKEGQERTHSFFSSLQNPVSTTVTRSIDRSVRSLNLRLLAQNANEIAPSRTLFWRRENLDPSLSERLPPTALRNETNERTNEQSAATPRPPNTSAATVFSHLQPVNPQHQPQSQP
jgi:hypothetical protein